MIIKVFTISNRLNVTFSQHVLIFVLIVLKCIERNYTDQFNYGLLLFLTAVISCLLFHVSKYELIVIAYRQYAPTTPGTLEIYLYYLSDLFKARYTHLNAVSVSGISVVSAYLCHREGHVCITASCDIVLLKTWH